MQTALNKKIPIELWLLFTTLTASASEYEIPLGDNCHFFVSTSGDLRLVDIALSFPIPVYSSNGVPRSILFTPNVFFAKYSENGVEHGRLELFLNDLSSPLVNRAYMYLLRLLKSEILTELSNLDGWLHKGSITQDYYYGVRQSFIYRYLVDIDRDLVEAPNHLLSTQWELPPSCLQSHYKLQNNYQ